MEVCAHTHAPLAIGFGREVVEGFLDQHFFEFRNFCSRAVMWELKDG